MEFASGFLKILNFIIWVSMGNMVIGKKKCFLCYAEREKSATKEATSILERVITSAGFSSFQFSMSK